MTDTLASLKTRLEDQLRPALPLPILTARFLQVLGETLAWDVGEVWTENDVPGSMHCAARWCASDIDPHDFCDTVQWAENPTAVARAWLNRHPVWISDVTHEPRLFARAPEAERHGLHTVAAFPIPRDVGVLLMLSRSIRKPSIDAIEALRLAALVFSHAV